ncbi:MAG: GNAT family N-acetyltransferase [Anaerolineales bacterium]|nr:GNAT family N-acetyltransferase [Anaerolineales bacterium]
MSITYDNRLPDKDQFFVLFESTGWNKSYALNADQLYQALQASWYSVSAYEQEKLVGFGRVLSDGVLHALIVEMIILPSHQGRGIGNAILDMLVKQCQSAGVRDIQLFCARGKAGFYERHGFIRRPQDAPGMGMLFELQDQTENG